MPKIYLTERDRSNARLSKWVYGEMKIRRITLSVLSEKMGISHQALSKKLKNARFDYSDFRFFVREFQPSDKELKEIMDL